MKNCLAIFPLEHSGLVHFSGIVRFFREMDASPFRLWHCEPGSSFTAEMVRDRRYDGFIVPLPGTDEAMAALAKSRKPTVLLNMNDRRLAGRTRNITSIWVDNFDIGQLGARHFLEQGDFKSFGFVRFSSDSTSDFYAKERETAFCRYLKNHGKTSVTFFIDTTVTNVKALGDWLRSLPKPTAVMGVNDTVILLVFKECRRIGLSVPGDIALLGVDDVPLITTGNGRSLSSIRPDFEKIGYLAAKELVRMLSGKSSNRTKEIVIPVDEIVVRNSTKPQLATSRLVELARAFIGRNAHREIKVSEVVALLGRSRRLADLRFKEFCNRTIRESIEDARLNLVMDRLRTTPTRVNELAVQLGFKSPNQLSRAFKRHFGKSIRTVLSEPKTSH